MVQDRLYGGISQLLDTLSNVRTGPYSMQEQQTAICQYQASLAYGPAALYQAGPTAMLPDDCLYIFVPARAAGINYH
jgi:hypothetical protein